MHNVKSIPTYYLLLYNLIRMKFIRYEAINLHKTVITVALYLDIHRWIERWILDVTPRKYES
jgi:hypothetical protein